jgi:hypothetical protein
MRAESEPAARALRTPQVAGAAGIVSGLLLGIAIVLIHRALPADSGDAVSWLADPSRQQALRTALTLMPFAGISFLWFMGAVRDHVGKAEDKFFTTIFLGSGLLFVAMLFVVAASAGSLLAAVEAFQTAPSPALWQYAREFTVSLLSNYAMRMAAVFAISTSVIGQHVGVFPRRLAWLGYLVALTLLLVAGSIDWSALIFPIWVLSVGGYILLATLRSAKT